MILSYSKNCRLDVLIESLMLNVLYDEFESIEMSEWKAGQDNIKIKLKRAFFSYEVDQITSIVNMYSSTGSMMMRKSIEDNITVPAMVSGRMIMAKYAAMNIYKNKTFPQYLTIFQETEKLTGFLLSGSLEMALYEMGSIKNNLPADGSITNDECIEFERRLQIEIGKLKG